MTKQAALAGKHVHCEKPFCRSTGEGQEAIAEAVVAGELDAGIAHLGHSARELRNMLADNGLACCGTHLSLDALLGDNLAQAGFDGVLCVELDNPRICGYKSAAISRQYLHDELGL